MVILPVATVAIAGVLLSCSGPIGAATTSNVETSESKGFQLSDLIINPSEVAARDEVEITAEVTNVSGADGTYNVEWKINGVGEASAEVSVPAGETKPLTFAMFKDRPGTYTVSLGPLAGQFVVSESIAAGPSNSLSGQAGGGCCAVANPAPSAAPVQQGAGCCGTATQSSSIVQSARNSGCGCVR